MLSCAFLQSPGDKLPILLMGAAGEKLRSLTTGTNSSHMLEPVAMAATVLQLQADLAGRPLILFAWGFSPAPAWGFSRNSR